MSTSGLTSLMNSGLKNTARQAIALAAIIKAKKAPDDAAKTELFGDLQTYTQMMAADVESGNFLSAHVTMIFVEGLGLGLGVITKEEIEDL